MWETYPLPSGRPRLPRRKRPGRGQQSNPLRNIPQNYMGSAFGSGEPDAGASHELGRDERREQPREARTLGCERPPDVLELRHLLEQVVHTVRCAFSSASTSSRTYRISSPTASALWCSSTAAFSSSTFQR